jgi:hypothetical protein
MAKDRHIYGEIDNKPDLEEVFSEIREDVKKPVRRPELTGAVPASRLPDHADRGARLGAEVPATISMNP